MQKCDGGSVCGGSVGEGEEVHDADEEPVGGVGANVCSSQATMCLGMLTGSLTVERPAQAYTTCQPRRSPERVRAERG